MGQYSAVVLNQIAFKSVIRSHYHVVLFDRCTMFYFNCVQEEDKMVVQTLSFSHVISTILPFFNYEWKHLSERLLLSQFENSLPANSWQVTEIAFKCLLCQLCQNNSPQTDTLFISNLTTCGKLLPVMNKTLLIISILDMLELWLIYSNQSENTP